MDVHTTQIANRQTGKTAPPLSTTKRPTLPCVLPLPRHRPLSAILQLFPAKRICQRYSTAIAGPPPAAGVAVAVAAATAAAAALPLLAYLPTSTAFPLRGAGSVRRRSCGGTTIPVAGRFSGSRGCPLSGELLRGHRVARDAQGAVVLQAALPTAPHLQEDQGSKKRRGGRR